MYFLPLILTHTNKCTRFIAVLHRHRKEIIYNDVVGFQNAGDQQAIGKTGGI